MRHGLRHGKTRLGLALAGCAVIAACGAYGRADDETSGPSPSEAGAADGAPAIEASTDAPLSDGAARLDANMSFPGSCFSPPPAICDATCDGGPCTSCAQLLATHDKAPSGLYRLQSRAGDELLSYCDMTTAGGGWLLVARSNVVAKDDIAFGWFVDSSKADPTSGVYSRDVRRLAFVPQEILFGSRGNAYDWGSAIYRLRLPGDFFEVFRSTAAAITDKLETIAGSCKVPTGFTHLRYIGYTGGGSYYFFRDVSGDSAFGLLRNGWNMNGANTCDMGGADIGGTQGMIFVR